MDNPNSEVRVLLGSGGISTDHRKEVYRDLVSQHFSSCEEVLFIPYASHDHHSYSERMNHFMRGVSPNLVGIETKTDPVSAVESADAIYVGGGNSFLLTRELHERGLVDPIKDLVLAGSPYLGVSAGANVACPTMMTTNDMPIAHPGTFESLGIVPFQINPHYHPGKVKFLDGGVLKEHFGESRDQRIAEFHRSFDTPVIGMWEGSFVHWNGSFGSLTGKATAFVKGQDSFEIPDGYRFDGDLGMEG